MLLCKARIINSAAYVIVGQKWNIDCEGRERLGGGIGQYKAKIQDKDSCYFLRPLYTNMERSAKATQCHTGLCWFTDPEQSAKWSRRPGSLNVIVHPFWPQEMPLCALCYISDQVRASGEQRFNFAVIECDSLITKGRTWSLISTPRAAGSAQDYHANRYLE